MQFNQCRMDKNTAILFSIPFTLIVLTTGFFIIGPCQAAGFETCCIGSNCLVAGDSCYCDVVCYEFNDCCSDIGKTCPLS